MSKSPSRLRYEERNPTISARVPRQFKEELQAHLDNTGQSYSQWLQASFNPEDQVAADIDEVWEKGHADGYDRAVFDVLLYLFREGWTDEVENLQDGYLHLGADVSIEDWLAAMSEFTRRVQDRFPER